MFSKVTNDPTVGPLIGNIIKAIVSPIIQVVFFVAMLVFVWGVFTLIKNGDDPAERETGQRHILWGVIGMFIMVSVYGIIRVIANTLNVPDPFL